MLKMLESNAILKVRDIYIVYIIILCVISFTCSFSLANCSEGSVRLVGGPGSYEGRLEVCFSGVWGTVHGSLNPFFIWSEFETRVICSQLGFNRTGMYMYISVLQ